MSQKGIKDRTALLICCSAAEASTIRQEATREFRSISGYMLNILSRMLTYDERFVVGETSLRVRPRRKLNQPRTEILLRCSLAEAKRIRSVARRTNMSISAFVLGRLRLSWKARGIRQDG